jgi:hypothetical protein
MVYILSNESVKAIISILVGIFIIIAILLFFVNRASIRTQKGDLLGNSNIKGLFSNKYAQQRGVGKDGRGGIKTGSHTRRVKSLTPATDLKKRMWALNSNRRFSTSSSTFNTNIDTDTNKDTDKKSKNGKKTYFKDKVKHTLIPVSSKVKVKRVSRRNTTYLSKDGFLSYRKIEYISSFGMIETDDNEIIKNNIQKVLNKLDKDKVYNVLPIMKWENGKNITMSKGFFISKESNLNLLSEKIQYEKELAEIKYGDGDAGEIYLALKEWKSESDFAASFDKVVKTLDELISDSLPKDSNDRDEVIRKLNLNEGDLYTSIEMDKYGEVLDSKSLESMGVVLLGGKADNNRKFFVVKSDGISKYKDNIEKKILDVSTTWDVDGMKINKINVRVLDSNGKLNLKDLFINWLDIQTVDGYIRERGSKRIHFKYDKTGLRAQMKISHIEVRYNFSRLISNSKEISLDENIGSIDFETFTFDDTGVQRTFAGGWKNKDKRIMFYADSFGARENDNIVVKVIDSIFINIKRSITIYAHNLGRFDGVEILKGIKNSNNYEVKGIWKSDENKLLSLTITEKGTRKSIHLLDSISLFNFASLENILKSYQIGGEKGVFPYSFVNKDNLDYIGNKPNIKYYDNITLKVYNSISKENWSMKEETLKYLGSDLDGLYDIIDKISKYYYDRYSVNITSYKTLPSLAMGIFTSNYYDEELDIRMIKGQVEKDIRSAYFGGAVMVVGKSKVIRKGNGYDMNSQYPNAMLQDMPIGNPTLTTEKDLENIFGFCYGTITPPSEKVLRVPIIPKKDVKGNKNIWPREPFKRWIFSEEIKDAIKYGYKFDLLYSYKFERGKNLFKDYVEIHFEDKKNTNDPVKRNIAKLLLNSLYGKFGMKDIESHMKIVDNKELENITNNYNYDVLAKISDTESVIKYTARISEKLRKLYKEMDKDTENDSNKTWTAKDFKKERGVPSAIQIAAAIGGYSLSSMNEYKNIPGNPCIYFDTDGIVLPKPLDAKYIGKELGQMKLEYIIDKAIYAGKKLYAVITRDGTEIIKAAGLNKKQLTFNDYENFIKGGEMSTTQNNFKVDWSQLQINILEEKRTKRYIDDPHKDDMSSGEIE